MKYNTREVLCTIYIRIQSHFSLHISYLRKYLCYGFSYFDDDLR